MIQKRSNKPNQASKASRHSDKRLVLVGTLVEWGGIKSSNDSAEMSVGEAKLGSSLVKA